MADIISEFPNKCMLVRIPISITYEKIYDAARRCWKANIDKARSSDYVLAVADGIVQGVFKPEIWHITTVKECEKDKKRCNVMRANTKRCEVNKRIRFDGVEAPAEVKKRYLNKEIPAKYQGCRNPVRYTFE
ncbi:hypothetical protein [Treponema sp. R80B11-R83G3]